MSESVTVDMQSLTGEQQALFYLLKEEFDYRHLGEILYLGARMKDEIVQACLVLSERERYEVLYCLSKKALED